MGRVYAILAAILGFAVMLLTAFAKGAEAATDKIEAQSEKHARKAEQKAQEAMLEGMENENLHVDENRPADRGRFT